MKLSFISSALVIMTAFASVSAYAAPVSRYYLSIEGVKQGRFRGESARRGQTEKMEGIRFQYEVKSPRDASTGLPSGKRQHHPIVITKEWGAASPQLFQALVTNEILKNVTIDFVKVAPTGAETIYQTIKLTNASVSSIRQLTDKTQPNLPEANDLEEFGLVFQKIEITNVQGGTVVDDWVSH